MTHMSIPTVPTARDRALAYEPRHKAGAHRARVSPCPDPTRDWASEAACTGGTGWKQVCPSNACPRHQPVAYAECMAQHTPETLVERARRLFNLDEYAAHVASYGPLDTGL